MERITEDRFEQMYAEGRNEEIIQAFENVKDEDRTYVETGMLIRANVMAGNYDETRRLLELVREEGKNDTAWYYRWGFLHLQLEDYPEAEKAFRKSLELNENDGDTTFMLCLVLDAMGREEEAEKISRELHETNPEEWEKGFAPDLANEPDENKERSVMAAIIPAGIPEETYSIETLLTRLKESSWFEVEELDFDEEMEVPVVTVEYNDELYQFWFTLDDFQMTDMFRLGHHLNQKNKELLEEAELSIVVGMYFSSEPMTSYLLQLKILQTLMLEQIAVADYSAFTVYSPVWAQLAAEASVPPAPHYLYTVHAVQGEKKGWFGSEKNAGVWLHTHGLNRCGFPELEILNSTVESSQNHYGLLNNMAQRAVTDRMIEEEEPLYVGQTQDSMPIVATWRHWEKVIDDYKKDMLGGRNDRTHEDHNGNTGIIYLYMSEEDYKNRKFSPVTVIPESDYENLLVMYTTEETIRMSTLARERLPYLIKGLQMEEASAIVKMGIPVDEDMKEEAGTDWEHIWFEVEKIDEQNITAKLLQEPYFFKHIQPGQIVTLPVESLTDWSLQVGETTLDPDRSYLLAAL